VQGFSGFALWLNEMAVDHPTYPASHTDLPVPPANDTLHAPFNQASRRRFCGHCHV